MRVREDAGGKVSWCGRYFVLKVSLWCTASQQMERRGARAMMQAEWCCGDVRVLLCGISGALRQRSGNVRKLCNFMATLQHH